ncbi:MAG TPA: hypothetical protein VN228_12775, partial [Pyrinomonadaceae bacterium]|nr:hypothetical protein [Pyrinomonadaceae bacterium]
RRAAGVASAGGSRSHSSAAATRAAPLLIRSRGYEKLLNHPKKWMPAGGAKAYVAEKPRVIRAARAGIKLASRKTPARQSFPS